MHSSICFRADHEELVKGLMKVFFEFHYPDMFYKFGFNSNRNYITLDFGSPGIGDYSYDDFFYVYTELKEICFKQECNFVLISNCFHSYDTFFC